MIAGMFTKGDLAIPMFIHSTTPPGVQIMQRLKDKITYDAENTERGAQLRITTHDPEACDAVYDFLRFQIQDHQTGDPITVRK
jgi:hypothetical protein